MSSPLRPVTLICFPNSASPIYSLLYLDRDFQEYSNLRDKKLTEKQANSVAKLIFSAVGMCDLDQFLPRDTYWAPARVCFMKLRKACYGQIMKLVQGSFETHFADAVQRTSESSGKTPLALFKEQFKDLPMPVQMIEILLDNELLPENFNRNFSEYVNGWAKEDEYGRKMLFACLDTRLPLPVAENSQQKRELYKFAQFLSSRAALCLRDATNTAKLSIIYVSWHTLLCEWARKTSKSESYKRVVDLCQLLQLPVPLAPDLKRQTKLSFSDYLIERSISIALPEADKELSEEDRNRREEDRPSVMKNFEVCLRDCMSMRLHEGVRKKILLALALGKRLELPSAHPRAKSLQYHFSLNALFTSANPLSPLLFDHDLTAKEWHDELQVALKGKSEETIILATEACREMLLNGCDEEKPQFLPLFVAVLKVKELRGFGLFLKTLFASIPFDKRYLPEAERSLFDLIERSKSTEDFGNLIHFCHLIKEHVDAKEFTFPLYFLIEFIFEHIEGKGNFFKMYTALKEAMGEAEMFLTFPEIVSKMIEYNEHVTEEEVLAYYRELFFDCFLGRITTDERDTLKLISMILSRNKLLNINFKMLEEIEKTRSGPKAIEVVPLTSRSSISVDTHRAVVVPEKEEEKKEEEEKGPEVDSSIPVKTKRRFSVSKVNPTGSRRASIVSATFGEVETGVNIWGSESGGDSTGEPKTEGSTRDTTPSPITTTGVIYNSTPSASSTTSYSQTIPSLDLGSHGQLESSSSFNSSDSTGLSVSSNHVSSPSMTPLTLSRRPSISSSPKFVPVSPGLMGRRESVGGMKHRRSSTVPAFAAIKEVGEAFQNSTDMQSLHDEMNALVQGDPLPQPIGLTPMITSLPSPSIPPLPLALLAPPALEITSSKGLTLPPLSLTRERGGKTGFHSKAPITMRQINLIKFFGDNLEAPRISSAVLEFWNTIGQVWKKYDLSQKEIAALFLSYFSFSNDFTFSLLDQNKIRMELEKSTKLLNDQLNKLIELEQMINRKLPLSLVFNWLMYAPDLSTIGNTLDPMTFDLYHWDSQCGLPIELNPDRGVQRMRALREDVIKKLFIELPKVSSTSRELVYRIDADHYWRDFRDGMITLAKEISFSTVPVSFQHIFDFMSIGVLYERNRNATLINALKLLTDDFTKGFASYVNWELPATQEERPVMVVSALNLTTLEATVSRFTLPWTEKAIKVKPALLDAVKIAERELQEENEEATKKKYSKEVVQLVEMIKKNHDFCLRWLASSKRDKHKVIPPDVAGISTTSFLFFDHNLSGGESSSITDQRSMVSESERVFTFDKSLPVQLRRDTQKIIDAILSSPLDLVDHFPFAYDEHPLNSSQLFVEFKPRGDVNEITLTIDKVSVKTRYYKLLFDPMFPKMFNWQLVMLMQKIYQQKGLRLTPFEAQGL